MRSSNFIRTPPRSAPREPAPLDSPAIRVATCTIRRRVDGESESLPNDTVFAIADANELADYEALNAVREPTEAELALFERRNPPQSAAEPQDGLEAVHKGGGRYVVIDTKAADAVISGEDLLPSKAAAAEFLAQERERRAAADLLGE